jgi:hypothetical protein
VHSSPRLGAKNIFQKGGKFSGGKNSQFSVHNYHAFYHVLTIKKPRSAHHFSENPLEKQGKIQRIHTQHRSKKQSPKI